MSAATATRPNQLMVGLLKTWQQSLPKFTAVELRHEDERTETLPKSPAAQFMRLAIDAEWRRRGGAR